jgi:hypothetical protein
MSTPEPGLHHRTDTFVLGLAVRSLDCHPEPLGAAGNAFVNCARSQEGPRQSYNDRRPAAGRRDAASSQGSGRIK